MPRPVRMLKIFLFAGAVGGCFLVLVFAISDTRYTTDDCDRKTRNSGKHGILTEKQEITNSHKTTETLQSNPNRSTVPVETNLGIKGDKLVNDSISKEMKWLQSIISTFQSLLPEQYLEGFKSQCWYPDYYVSSVVSSIFHPHHEVDQETRLKYSKQAVHSMYSSSSIRSTKQLVCLPDFFLIGFQKCGTTTISNMLNLHPDYAAPEYKELHLFTHFEFVNQYPINVALVLRYLYHFLPAGRKVLKNPKSAVVGDMSVAVAYALPLKANPNVMYSDGLPYLFSKLFPSKKYIVILRNPTERTKSYYYFFNKFSCPQPPNSETFHEAVEDSISSYRLCLAKGFDEEQCTKMIFAGLKIQPNPCHQVMLPFTVYYIHIAKWLRYFPRKQFLFLRMEDLQINATKVAVDILNFLNMDYQSTDELLKKIAGEGKKKINANNNIHSVRKGTILMKDSTRRLLDDFFEIHNKKLAQLLEDDRFLWKDT